MTTFWHLDEVTPETVSETSTTDAISSIIISDINSSNVTTDEVDPPSRHACSPTPLSGRALKSKSKDVVRVFRLSSCLVFLSPPLPFKSDSKARGAAVAMRLTGLRMLGNDGTSIRVAFLISSLFLFTFD
eukprot:CCRYP_008469-RA/>CCRYP_008469-RA protein AED:0.46 eAED:1.00 QI:0/0/0/1/1/1/2/0/129